MTKFGWKEAVLAAVHRAECNDFRLLDLLAELLEEQDMAKDKLSNRYGWTGIPWPRLVDEVYASWVDPS
jgi:hypothetical protein